jgi:hypothetical protein
MGPPRPRVATMVSATLSERPDESHTCISAGTRDFSRDTINLEQKREREREREIGYIAAL